MRQLNLKLEGFKVWKKEIYTEQRNSALNLNLQLSESKANQLLLERYQIRLPNQLFNFAFQNAKRNLDLDRLYLLNGTHPQLAARVRAVSAINLLNQIIFEGTGPFTIQNPCEVKELIELCKNRIHFYNYCSDLEYLFNNQLSLDQLIKRIQSHIDALNDPRSDQICTLMDQSRCFVLPIDWKTHSFTVRFRKIKDSFYFEINNKGLGCNYSFIHGDIAFLDPKTGHLYQKTTVRIKTSFEALKNTEFLRTLFSEKGEGFYQSIISHLLDPNAPLGILECTKLENELQDLFDRFKITPPEHKPQLVEAALSLIKKDKTHSFNPRQVYGTCVETNFTSSEIDMASANVRKSLFLYSLECQHKELSRIVDKKVFTPDCLPSVQELIRIVNNKIIKLNQQSQNKIQINGPALIPSYISLSTEEQNSFYKRFLQNKMQICHIYYLPKFFNNKDFALGAIRECVKNFDYLSEQFKNDPQVVAAVLLQQEKTLLIDKIKKKQCDYKQIPQTLINNIDIIQAIVSAGHVPPHLMHNLEFIKTALKQNPLVYLNLEPETKRMVFNPELITPLLKSMGGINLLKNCVEIRNDRDVVLESVQECGLAIQYASDKLKNKPAIVLAALKKNPEAFLFISPQWLEEPKVKTLLAQTLHLRVPFVDAITLIGMMRRYPYIIQHLLPNHWRNPLIALETIRLDPINIKNVSEAVLRQIKPRILGLVEKPEFFQIASEAIREDRECILAAIKKSPVAWKFVGPKAKLNKLLHQEVTQLIFSK